MTQGTSETQRISHWIGGQETPGTSGRTAPVYNPAAGVVSAEVDLAAGSEIAGAVATAVAAAKDWRHASLSKRSGVLFAFRELLRFHSVAGEPLAQRAACAPTAGRRLNGF